MNRKKYFFLESFVIFCSSIIKKFLSNLPSPIKLNVKQEAEYVFRHRVFIALILRPIVYWKGFFTANIHYAVLSSGATSAVKGKICINCDTFKYETHTFLNKNTKSFVSLTLLFVLSTRDRCSQAPSSDLKIHGGIVELLLLVWEHDLNPPLCRLDDLIDDWSGDLDFARGKKQTSVDTC